MTQEQALTPRAERMVNFYGDQITVALLGEDEPYVPLRTLTEYLGLEWSSQYRRVQRDGVLARSTRTLTVHGADGKLRDMVCLPLDKLPGWLFGITVSKIRAELAPKLERYREECFYIIRNTPFTKTEVYSNASNSLGTLSGRRRKSVRPRLAANAGYAWLVS